MVEGSCCRLDGTMLVIDAKMEGCEGNKMLLLLAETDNEVAVVRIEVIVGVMMEAESEREVWAGTRVVLAAIVKNPLEVEMTSRLPLESA